MVRDNSGTTSELLSSNSNSHGPFRVIHFSRSNCGCGKFPARQLGGVDQQQRRKHTKSGDCMKTFHAAIILAVAL